MHSLHAELLPVLPSNAVLAAWLSQQHIRVRLSMLGNPLMEDGGGVSHSRLRLHHCAKRSQAPPPHISLRWLSCLCLSLSVRCADRPLTACRTPLQLQHRSKPKSNHAREAVYRAGPARVSPTAERGREIERVGWFGYHTGY